MTLARASLIPPGRSVISLAALEKIVSWPGCPARRSRMFDAVAAFIGHLHGIGLHGQELWIDGSFVSPKPEPADWDAVLWLSDEDVRNCTQSQYHALQALKLRKNLRQRYGADLYIGRWDDAEERDYWHRWFSADRDGAAKGYAVIIL
ncbi:DUF6932 family protein [Tepidimonas charontis]